MKKTVINDGKHRPFSIIPPFVRNIRFNRRKIQTIGYDLLFDGSCEYMLDRGDQFDWNKLYGWCFGIGGLTKDSSGKIKFVGGNHRDSVRWGWRYNLIERVVEIAPYVYMNSEVIMPNNEDIVKIPIGVRVATFISVDGNNVKMSLFCNSINFKKEYEFSKCEQKTLFGCWFYFGGNRRAPRNITFRYTKTT